MLFIWNLIFTSQTTSYVYYKHRQVNDLFININQLDALNFTISLFQVCTCFEYMCSSSGGQKLYYTVSGIITRRLFQASTCFEHMCSSSGGQILYYTVSGIITLRLFQASTCFEHMCSSSGGQNCIIQSLVSSHWNKWVV